MLNIIKIGSACLFDEQRRINYALLQQKAREIEESTDETVLVVSGAIALGKLREGERRRNAELQAVELQGYACFGQPELMHFYRGLFTRGVSQVLVTARDVEHRSVVRTNVRDLIAHNLERHRITLINYNDGVDFEQLRQDNDTLAATILSYCHADRLLVLGHYDGFYVGGQLQERVSRIDADLYDYCQGQSEHGNGGFTTKLDAAKVVMGEGKEMIVGNIKYALDDLIQGRVQRTLFKLEGRKMG